MGDGAHSGLEMGRELSSRMKSLHYGKNSNTVNPYITGRGYI
jgi:hypothetical protein